MFAFPRRAYSEEKFVPVKQQTLHMYTAATSAAHSLASSLQRLLRLRAENGEAAQPFPKMLYTVPIGQNPTGFCTPEARKRDTVAPCAARLVVFCTPEARKRDIYEICREFDLVLVEDDPYIYLQYPNGPGRVLELCLVPRGFQSCHQQGAGGAGHVSLSVDCPLSRLLNFFVYHYISFSRRDASPHSRTSSVGFKLGGSRATDVHKAP